MASCNLCNSFGPTKIRYSYDLAKEHAKTHFLQSMFLGDEMELNQIFEQCFPEFMTVPNSRRDLIALCRSLFPRKSLSESSMSHIICEKCDAEIKITDRWKRLAPDVLIEHACGHLKFNIYECRHCDHEFKSKRNIFYHMITNHQLRTTVGHFRNKVDDFVGEITAMINECFGGRMKSTNSDGDTIKTASISKVRRCTKGSRWAIERQLHCYRLIRKRIDRNGKVNCHLCSKGVKATQGKTIQCLHIREHSYRHLPTPLYRCRVCSEASFTRSAAEVHLRSVHALPFLGQNYECLADQYHTDILAMLNKCYGDESDSSMQIAYRNLDETQICMKSTRSKLTVRRHLLCYRLIRKCADAERMVQCRLCSKRISAKDKNTFTCHRAMQHAFLHLGKKVYQCKTCSDSFVNRFGMSKHLKVEHALPLNEMYYRRLADQFHGEIVAVLRQCYGGDENEEDEVVEAPTAVKCEPKVCTSASVSRLQSKMTIERQTLCKQLTREYIDPKDGCLPCRLCNKRISVRINDTRVGKVMMHALVHLDQPMYRCNICTEMFTTRNNIGQHLIRKHALPMANNYDCSADQFHAEIMEILRKCYNDERAVESQQPFKSQTMIDANVRKRVNGSKQTVERHLFCCGLIRKFVSPDGKVECLLCKKRLAAKKADGYQSQSVMTHAMVHLKKPMYRCVVCSETRPYISFMKHHLKATHALPLANNYESLADEYHSEILAMLRECFEKL